MKSNESHENYLKPFFSQQRNPLCVPLILLIGLDLKSSVSVAMKNLRERTISLSLQKDIFILPNPDRRLQI